MRDLVALALFMALLAATFLMIGAAAWFWTQAL